MSRGIIILFKIKMSVWIIIIFNDTMVDDRVFRIESV